MTLQAKPKVSSLRALNLSHNSIFNEHFRRSFNPLKKYYYKSRKNLKDRFPSHRGFLFLDDENLFISNKLSKIFLGLSARSSMSNQVFYTWGMPPGEAAANVCNSFLNCQKLFEPIFQSNFKSDFTLHFPERQLEMRFALNRECDLE